MRLAILAAAAVLLPAAAGGCSSEMSSANRLDETLRAYHHHLLARDQERASAYVTEAAMDAFLDLHGEEEGAYEIEDFHVASVRFLPQKDSKDPLQARVMIALDARKRDSIVVKTVRLSQLWEQRGGSRWVMIENGIAPVRPRGADAPGDEKAPP